MLVCFNDYVKKSSLFLESRGLVALQINQNKFVQYMITATALVKKTGNDLS